MRYCLYTVCYRNLNTFKRWHLILQTANKGGNDRGCFSYAESRESQSLSTVPQMPFLTHDSADIDGVDWIFPSDRQLSGFPQLSCLPLKYGMKRKWIFVGRISHLSSIKWRVCVCARARKILQNSYLHWFNQHDRGLHTWRWKWENSQYHLAHMILETTNTIVYTSLNP